MKIAMIDFVLDPAKPGASGLSDVVWNTARELAKLGDDIHIVGPYTVDPEPVPGITVHRFAAPPIGYRNIIGHVLIVLKAWRIIRRLPDVDLIYAVEYLSSGVIAPFSRTPVAIRTPGNIYERLATMNPFDWSTTQVYKLAARSSARFCPLIIAISHDMARWWKLTGAGDQRVVVIANGIDVERFRPLAEPVTENDDDRLKALFVGRLSREKGCDVLLDAVAKVVEARAPIHLDIIGDGPLRAELEATCRREGLADHVRFHGWRPQEELPRHYASADVLVVPSLSEPLGRVVLEAMACGTPVIGARTGGIPDHVRPGVNGFLVKPGDAGELANRLMFLQRDPRLSRQLGKQARTYIQEHQTWELVAGRVRDAVINSLDNTARVEPIESQTGALKG